MRQAILQNLTHKLKKKMMFIQTVSTKYAHGRLGTRLAGRVRGWQEMVHNLVLYVKITSKSSGGVFGRRRIS